MAMFTVLEAIIPITMLIAFGWWLKHRYLQQESFWSAVDRLVYFGAFPALLLRTFTRVDWAGIDVLPLAAASIGSVFLITLTLLAIRKKLDVDGPGFTSVLQGALRYNSYIGIGVAASLYDVAGMTMFAIVMAFITPAGNTLCILMLERYGTRGRGSLKDAITTIAKNPLILSILGGIFLAWSGIGLPWVFDPFAEILGRIALPLGLLSVGAGMNFGAFRQSQQALVVASLFRLVAMPIAVLLICALLGVEGLTRTAILIYACIPCSPGSYILARQLNGDATLMASIITVTSLAAIIATPFWLGLFGS